MTIFDDLGAWVRRCATVSFDHESAMRHCPPHLAVYLSGHFIRPTLATRADYMTFTRNSNNGSDAVTLATRSATSEQARARMEHLLGEQAAQIIPDPPCLAIANARVLVTAPDGQIATIVELNGSKLKAKVPWGASEADWNAIVGQLLDRKLRLDAER